MDFSKQLILKPIEARSLGFLRQLFPTPKRFKLNLDQRQLMLGRDQIARSRLEFTTVISRGDKYIPALKLKRGPLLALGKSASHNEASLLARQIANLMLLPHEKDGSFLILDALSAGRKTVFEAKLCRLTIDGNTLSLPMRALKLDGVAYCELVADRGKHLSLFNGLGDQKIISKLNSIAEVSTGYRDEVKRSGLVVNFHGKSGRIFSALIPRTPRTDERIYAIQQFIKSGVPTEKMSPKLKELILREVDK